MDLQIIFVFGSVCDGDDVAVAIVMSYIDVAVATSSLLGRRCPPPCCLVALVVGSKCVICGWLGRVLGGRGKPP